MKKVLITGGEGDIAKAVRARLEKLGGYEVACPGRHELDVTDPDSAREYVERFTPDILVNNAGAVSNKSIRECDILAERRVIEVDLFGPFNCTAAVLAKNPKARIVVVGSSASVKVHGDWSSYCAAKAGVVMAVKCWAADGVDAVCMSPGRTRTKMRRGLFPNEDQSTLIDPDDFAATVVLAAQGRYKPGTHIFVTVKNVRQVISGEITTDNENV